MEKPNVIFFVSHPTVKIVLKDGDKTIDEVLWDDKNNLSLALLASLDKLLKKHGLEVSQLEGFRTEAIEASYSSSRIAQVAADTFNYCLTSSKKSLK